MDQRKVTEGEYFETNENEKSKYQNYGMQLNGI